MRMQLLFQMQQQFSMVTIIYDVNSTGTGNCKVFRDILEHEFNGTGPVEFILKGKAWPKEKRILNLLEKCERRFNTKWELY